jgi:hypothetical protein
MWKDLSTAIPRLRQGEPASWAPFTEVEAAAFASGRHPRLELQGTHRFFLRNGVDKVLLALDVKVIQTPLSIFYE